MTLNVRNMPDGIWRLFRVHCAERETSVRAELIRLVTRAVSEPRMLSTKSQSELSTGLLARASQLRKEILTFPGAG